MLFTIACICGTTSGALAQEGEPSLFTPEANDYIPAKRCWCIKNEDLVKAAFAMKFSKVQLELKDKELQQRLEAATSGCKLKMDTSREWFDAQLEVTRKGCAAQVELVLNQTETLIENLTAANIERLRATTDLLGPAKTEWYKHPAFVGGVSGVAGIGIGVLIGIVATR